MSNRQGGASTLGTLGLGLLLFLLVLVVLNIGHMHYELAKAIREHPELSLQPIPLGSALPLKATGTQLDCYGVQFAVPWGKPESDKCEFVDKDRVAFFRWPDGREFRMRWPEIVIDRNALSEGDDPADRGWIQRCFGDMTETRYDAMGRMLHYVPRRPVFNLLDLFCQHALIMWKQSAIGTAPTALYSFQTETGRGFQVGDPASSREVRIHFYDNEKDFHHCIAILAKDEAPALAQPEIDFILRSLRYVHENDKTGP